MTNHNNLCCVLNLFIICEECGFRSCTPCDNIQGNWTLTTHNEDCAADNSRWDTDKYIIIIYKDKATSKKTPIDILTSSANGI